MLLYVQEVLSIFYKVIDIMTILEWTRLFEHKLSSGPQILWDNVKEKLKEVILEKEQN